MRDGRGWRERLKAWLGRSEPPRPGGVPLKGEDAEAAILSSGTPYDLHTPIDEGGDTGGSIVRDVGPAGAAAGARPRQPGDRLTDRT